MRIIITCFIEYDKSYQDKRNRMSCTVQIVLLIVLVAVHTLCYLIQFVV